MNDSNDAFAVLGLEASPSLNKQDIKRAYRKMALKYHPDVVTTKDSSSGEKQLASDRFAKINWAYETLSGKNGNTGSSSGSSSSSSTSSSGWTPPHQRTSSTSSNTGKNYGSTDWRDYMPNYENEDAKYETDDSLGSIFSDLLTGVAGMASSSSGSGAGGVFKDFVEFLEQNVDGYSTNTEDEAQLRILLQTGTVKQVGAEMDETDLVVQGLTSKLTNLQTEFMQAQADSKLATSYTERMQLEESMAELEAQQQIVKNYMKKAQKRLTALQTRYKQLIVQGGNDPTAGGGRQQQQQQQQQESAAPKERPRHESKEDAWKDDSFGSSGRRRGSSRGRRQPESSSSSSSYSTEQSTSRSAEQSIPRSTVQSSPSSTQQSPNSNSNVPPHRRASTPKRSDDRTRLRELKVDEEFDKLKRDLGL
jgi:hypothetical protein